MVEGAVSVVLREGKLLGQETTIMKMLYVFAVSLALVGCRQGDGQQEVVNRLKALETEMAKQRPVPLRWAFADRAKIKEAIQARAREKVEELKKVENLSPEMATKLAEYEALNRELMLSGMHRPYPYSPTRSVPNYQLRTSPGLMTTNTGPVAMPAAPEVAAALAQIHAQTAGKLSNATSALPALPPTSLEPPRSPRLVPSRDGLTTREVPERPARLAIGGSTPPLPSPVSPAPSLPMAPRFD